MKKNKNNRKDIKEKMQTFLPEATVKVSFSSCKRTDALKKNNSKVNLNSKNEVSTQTMKIQEKIL